ncbi:MAG: hypothetical protein PHV33_13300 [Elusimicrobiales bacterium]|nr:hypothetical protein [Elusimicrobiales bacterium]
MAATERALFLGAALALLPAAAAAEGAWSRELKVAAGFSHSRNRIFVEGYFYDRVKTDLSLKLRGEFDRDSAGAKWANTVTLDYASGWTKDETLDDDHPRWVESKDQLIADSVYRYKTGFFADPYGSGNFQTSIHDTRFDTEFRAFRPVQVRESLGLIFTILDGGSQELTLRGGWFNQHYFNSRLYHHDRLHGLEAVLEYDGRLGPAVEYEMKGGVYTGLVATDDSWNRLTESRKCALEWDNTLTVSLAKHLKLIFSFNLDNKDVSSTEIDYEWEQGTSLALSWKVF